MNLFDIFKEFRRGNTILSKDFNDLQYALVGSFKKLGTERVDSETGVEETFSVGEPIKPVNAATKGYVDQQILDNVAVDGATGPRGPQGEVGPQGLNLVLSGTVPTEADLEDVEAEQGDVYVADDTDIAYCFSDGEWVDIGLFGGPPGPKGTPGVNGSNGEPGAQGYPGTNGTNGSVGEKGPKGDKGATGPRGTPGASYNGPEVESGAVGEMLIWTSNLSSPQWVATDVMKLTGGRLYFKQLATGTTKNVKADGDGNIYATEASKYSDVQLAEMVDKLERRLAKLEKKR